MVRPAKSRVSLAKAALAASLVLALLIIMGAAGVIHFHQGDESAGNCRICQVAHVPFAPIVVRVVLPAPARIVRAATVTAQDRYIDPLRIPGHSRAPPA